MTPTQNPSPLPGPWRKGILRWTRQWPHGEARIHRNPDLGMGKTYSYSFGGQHKGTVGGANGLNRAKVAADLVARQSSKS